MTSGPRTLNRSLETTKLMVASQRFGKTGVTQDMAIQFQRVTIYSELNDCSGFAFFCPFIWQVT